MRRIPFWFVVDRAAARRRAGALADAAGHRTPARPSAAPTRRRRYRYPTGGDDDYPGPERVYRIDDHRPAGELRRRRALRARRPARHLRRRRGPPRRLHRAAARPQPVPHDLRRGAPVAGAVLPAPGTYDIVFDTRRARRPGPFTFRYWVNDVDAAELRARSTRGAIVVAATDAGSGVDPSSIVATLDGKHGRASRLRAARSASGTRRAAPARAPGRATTRRRRTWRTSRRSCRTRRRSRDRRVRSAFASASRSRSSIVGRFARSRSTDRANSSDSCSGSTTRRCASPRARFARAAVTPRPCARGAATRPPRAARAPRRAGRGRPGSRPKDRRLRRQVPAPPSPREFGLAEDTHRSRRSPRCSLCAGILAAAVGGVDAGRRPLTEPTTHRRAQMAADRSSASSTARCAPRRFTVPATAGRRAGRRSTALGRRRAA